MLEGLFQPMHLLVIFFIALLVFGPKKLPELGKGIGEGIRALKDGMKDASTDQRPPAATEVKTRAASGCFQSPQLISRASALAPGNAAAPAQYFLLTRASRFCSRRPVSYNSVDLHNPRAGCSKQD